MCVHSNALRLLLSMHVAQSQTKLTISTVKCPISLKFAIEKPQLIKDSYFKLDFHIKIKYAEFSHRCSQLINLLIDIIFPRNLALVAFHF